jgi:hypothetical protein
VLDDVEADGLDPLWRRSDGLQRPIFLLDRLALLLAAIGEDAIEDRIEGGAEDA